MTDPSAPDAARTLAALALQLERDRRTFLVGGIAWTAANLVLAGLVWVADDAGPLGWALAAVAFLANVFYAIVADWEQRWEQLWRRSAPRLERRLGEGGEILTPVLAESAGARRLQRGLKFVAWGVAAAWLVALLLALRAAGLDFGLAG